MRQLLPVPATAGESLDDDRLAALYAFPDTPTLRTNFVTTLDGAATGHDGRSGTINNAADNRVFALQRTLCDAVLVGAGTARAEGYETITADEVSEPPPLVVVSHSGSVPGGLAITGDGRGRGVLVTCRAAGEAALDAAREALGEEDVWILGDDAVDLSAVRERLTAQGLRRVLCEGGPSLHADLLTAGLVDEVALTWVPRLLGGDHPRMAHGAAVAGDARLLSLLEEDGTLLGLWSTRR
ncbi:MULTISPECIES: dihydrofolate reductase family protein [unclassified Janibacter]|uniref:dihydrofolate reductase family protein n=1 Tax=unclassified Janibacter TaxID=2649294 RepID=UPI003CFC25C8